MLSVRTDLCFSGPICLQTGPAITRARKRAAGASAGLSQESLLCRAQAVTQLTVPACCQEGVETLRRQSAQPRVLQSLIQATGGCPGTQRNQAQGMLPAVSVEVDQSVLGPVLISAACCPPSSCAATVPVLFVSFYQANSGMTSFSWALFPCKPWQREKRIFPKQPCCSTQTNTCEQWNAMWSFHI